MATMFNFFRSTGNQFSTQTTDQWAHPAGFVPLDVEQMKRVQGGFDTEGDTGGTGGDPGSEDDPLEGDPPIEDLDIE